MNYGGIGNRTSTNGDFQGFVAQHYDLWFGESANSADQAFYKELITRNGGPALEIGCGTGRLLHALVREGMDVDGVDYSEDMLAVCRRRFEPSIGHPGLYHQAVQHLSLPRKYHTIFIPGNTFNLLTNRPDAMEALRRLHQHLAAEGQLLLTLTVPKGYIRNEQPEHLWRVLAEAKRSDGALVRLSERVELDYWEQIKMNYNKYEVFNDGELTETHEDTIRLRWFYRNEFELMLEAAGFNGIEFSYDVTSLGEDRSSMMVVAHK